MNGLLVDIWESRLLVEGEGQTGWCSRGGGG